jgi:hypothetical protein
MDEYRAFYVGHLAEHGRAPDQREALDHMRGLLVSGNGSYFQIRKALLDRKEGDKILDFLRRGLGRETITREGVSVLPPGNPELPGPLPERSAKEDPNVLDNAGSSSEPR